jgi:hypothetical protein
MFPEETKIFRGLWNLICDLRTLASARDPLQIKPMLPIELKIDRAQRLLQMIEQDAPLLALRLAPLSAERQQSAKSYAQELAAHTRAEIKRLLDEKTFAESELSLPGAD